MRIRRMNNTFSQTAEKIYEANKEKTKAKVFKANTSTGKGFIESILNNPNLAIQIMVIILTMSSENMQMERRMESVSTTVDKVKNIADVLSDTMNSVKVAAETPRKIRQLLD